ncbi:septal ring lytic transglycosylase RlpA family protein [Acidovorax sp.]|uniref:septal ring lytic transglycosylase RlpA family protein n=1 Tax=Acidovorax sp. TaxID=1872122 RepID=UPI00391F0089
MRAASADFLRGAACALLACLLGWPAAWGEEAGLRLDGATGSELRVPPDPAETLPLRPVTAGSPGLSRPSLSAEAADMDDDDDDAPGADEGPLETGLASWYGQRFHRRRTASGELFDMNAMTAAHRTLAFGTRICVRDRETGKGVVVRVNDRGPHVANRIVDLSRGAALALGVQGGLKPVDVFPVGGDAVTCPPVPIDNLPQRFSLPAAQEAQAPAASSRRSRAGMGPPRLLRAP